jgi:hypothetical protein
MVHPFCGDRGGDDLDEFEQRLIELLTQHRDLP